MSWTTDSSEGIRFDDWYNWIVAHRRDGEDVQDAAHRLATTYAYVHAVNAPIKSGGLRSVMARKLRAVGNLGTVAVRVHRLVQKYRLTEVV